MAQAIIKKLDPLISIKEELSSSPTNVYNLPWTVQPCAQKFTQGCQCCGILEPRFVALKYMISPEEKYHQFWYCFDCWNKCNCVLEDMESIVEDPEYNNVSVVILYNSAPSLNPTHHAWQKCQKIGIQDRICKNEQNIADQHCKCQEEYSKQTTDRRMTEYEYGRVYDRLTELGGVIYRGEPLYGAVKCFFCKQLAPEVLDFCYLWDGMNGHNPLYICHQCWVDGNNSVYNSIDSFQQMGTIKLYAQTLLVRDVLPYELKSKKIDPTK